MPGKYYIIGALFLAVGALAMAEFHRERSILLPLSERPLNPASSPLHFAFRPKRSDRYQVILWGRYPDTPLDEILDRFNAQIGRKEKHPEKWIDLEWHILKGVEVVARGSIGDSHGFLASSPDYSPVWPEFRLDDDSEYVLQLRVPKHDAAFYASKPIVSIAIGDEFQQDGGLAPWIWKWPSRVFLLTGAVVVTLGAAKHRRVAMEPLTKA